MGRFMKNRDKHYRQSIDVVNYNSNVNLLTSLQNGRRRMEDDGLSTLTYQVRRSRNVSQRRLKATQYQVYEMTWHAKQAN